MWERLGGTGEVTCRAATAQPAGMGDDPLLAADRARAVELLDRTWSSHACPRPSVWRRRVFRQFRDSPGLSRFRARAGAVQRPKSPAAAGGRPPNPVIAVTAVISLIPGFPPPLRGFSPSEGLAQGRCSRWLAASSAITASTAITTLGRGRPKPASTPGSGTRGFGGMRRPRRSCFIQRLPPT